MPGPVVKEIPVLVIMSASEFQRYRILAGRLKLGHGGGGYLPIVEIPYKMHPAHVLGDVRRNLKSDLANRLALKKLFTPNIEKGLIFLDDSLLPSTSNAVERGYRRHRKMQKTIYRVRTQEHISQRIASDMQREEQSQGRLQTITMLHNERREAS